MKKCSKCNSSIPKGDLFCKICGVKVEQSRVKEKFIVLALLGAIFLLLWIIWLAVANLNISWLYNGFRYPSILIALVTILYGFVYALRGKTKIGGKSDDLVLFSWVAKKGKRHGKLEEVISNRVDGTLIGLGIYEASRKNVSFYQNKDFELDNLEIPNYLIGLITFLKEESIIDKESLDQSLTNRYKIPTSRYTGKYDKEVNHFIGGLTRELQDKSVINPHIKKAQYIVRGVAVFLLLFAFASFVRMEVEAIIVITYVLEGIILLFLSRYIFGLGISGKEIKQDVKDYKRLLKEPMSLIMEKNSLSDALAVAVALNKEKKFIKKANKFTEDDYLTINSSDEVIRANIDEMHFYLSIGKILYSNSKVGEKSVYSDDEQTTE